MRALEPSGSESSANKRTSRLHSSPALALGIALGLFLVAGCTNKKQEATEKLDKAIKKCRAADGLVYQVPLMRGDEKTPVLTKACEQEKGDVEMVDEFTAEVDVGPYTWEAGRDQTIGVWLVKSVTWEPLDRARTLLENDPGANELDRGAENLRKAQNEFPSSEWIRLELLQTLVERRIEDRSSDASSLELGDAVEKQLSSTVEWAHSHDKPAVAAEARLKVIDYLEGFIEQVEKDKKAIGSNDDYLKRSAEVAEEAGNEKKAEQYRKELETLKKQRPKKRDRYDRLVERAEKQLCHRFDELETEGIEDEELVGRIKSAKDGINCRKILEETSASQD